MRKALILSAVCLLLAGFNWSLVHKERLRATGRSVLLSLAPVDPRAPLMGDYMALDFAVNRDISAALRGRYGEEWDPRGRTRPAWPSSGLAVLRLAEAPPAGELPAREEEFSGEARQTEHPAAGVAIFVRLDDGSPLAAGEMRLLFRVRAGWAHAASSTFYFQEGRAGEYARARYGLLRLGEDGGNLLVDLCGADGRPIVPAPWPRGTPAR